MSCQPIYDAIDKPGTILEKIQAIADEVIEKVQEPLKPGDEHSDAMKMSLWWQASVLFEFSLAFLILRYPSLSPEREKILGVFRDCVVKLDLKRRQL